MTSVDIIIELPNHKIKDSRKQTSVNMNNSAFGECVFLHPKNHNQFLPYRKCSFSLAIVAQSEITHKLR